MINLRKNYLYLSEITTIYLIFDRKDIGSCQIAQMESNFFAWVTSGGGVILSPHFPSEVSNDLWRLTFVNPGQEQGAHFDIYVYYVRGPTVVNERFQSVLQT